MVEFREVTSSISVPKNAGLDGFLHTIKEILKRPRVQAVAIDSKGVVTYKRLLKEGEEQQDIQVSFDALSPAYILRNLDGFEEVPLPIGLNGAIAIGVLFERVSQDQLYPIAFVGGASTLFWDWYSLSTGLKMRPRPEVYGLPFLTDRGIPDSALILCASYLKEASLVDVERAYKVEMERPMKVPTTTVEIL